MAFAKFYWLYNNILFISVYQSNLLSYIVKNKGMHTRIKSFVYICIGQGLSKLGTKHVYGCEPQFVSYT